jgi:arylsulfatase A-like enzyme
LTSRYPSQIRWQHESYNFSPILDENTTFFEVMHEAGIHTVGEFSHFYLDKKTGVAQGFDEWDNAGALTLHDSNTDSAAPRITPRVIKKLHELAANPSHPFALWTHLFEPHSGYMAHPEYPARKGGAQALEGKYDAEVSFADAHLGRIFAALKKEGLWDKTAIVVFADHGESFGEHRFAGQPMYFHGETLYSEVLHVPLMFRVPGRAPRHVPERVMLLDLGPTLVDLLGLARPASFVGRSLLPALGGAPLAEVPVWAELLPATAWQHSWRVLIDGNWKLIDRISENALELYDIAADPGEQHNLALEQAATAQQRKQAARAFMARLRSPETRPRPSPSPSRP